MCVCVCVCVMGVFAWMQHADYNNDACTYCNDIAMLKLASDLTFSDSVGAGDVASGSEDYAGETCEITGWGRTGGCAASLASTESTKPGDTFLLVVYTPSHFLSWPQIIQ